MEVSAAGCLRRGLTWSRRQGRNNDKVKVAVLAELGRFELRTQPRPRPGGGDLLVRVEHCGICGSDVRTFRHGHARITLPQVLGHEIAGTVAEVGPDVASFSPDDRVAVMPKVFCGTCFYCARGQTNFCEKGRSFGYQLPGGFAEYVLVPGEGARQGTVLRLPPSVASDEASLIEPMACCLRSQRNARCSLGDAVVVIGGGPIGTIHGRLARHHGAARVILLERNERRLAGADRRAFDTVIDVREEDPVEAVRRETEGRGADLVIVACPSRDAQLQAIAMAGNGGRVDLFSGLPPGAEPIPVDSNWLHYHEIAVRSTHGATKDDWAASLELLAGGAVHLADLISHRPPLSEIQDAFEGVERNEATKVVVMPSGGA